MADFEDRDWEALVRRIEKGHCTPFLGAGVNRPYLKLGREIAEILAKKYKYPFPDAADLIRVAQYVAVDSGDPMRPKEEILAILEEDLRACSDDVIFAGDAPLGVLAELPFSVYMTTNYDPLMHRALHYHRRDARREYCRWNLATQLGRKAKMAEPTAEHPVVYHLHGVDEVRESIVATEDDYVTFLVNLSKDIIPENIRARMAGGLLFLGYSLEDWNFRVLHQGILSTREATTVTGSVSVQVAWERDPDRRRALERYLERHFQEKNIRIYWGQAQDFLAELKRWWEKRAR